MNYTWFFNNFNPYHTYVTGNATTSNFNTTTTYDTDDNYAEGKMLDVVAESPYKEVNKNGTDTSGLLYFSKGE